MEENKKKNKKRIIIICILVILTIVIVICINDYKQPEIFPGGDLSLICEISKDNYGSDNQLLTYEDNVGIGDILECHPQISLDSYYKEYENEKFSNLREIWIPNDDSYSSELIDLNVSKDWKIEYQDKYIRIIADNQQASLDNIILKYKINNIYDKYKISIDAGDTLLKFSNDKRTYSQYMCSKKFNTYKYRITKNQDSNTYKFYKLSDKKEFELINEFTTTNKSYIDNVDYNEGIALIYADDYTYHYDMDKGILQKYQSGPVTYNLFSSEPQEGSTLGEYIYTQMPDSNEKYGIVDKYGNVVHDFDLNGTHSIGHGSGQILSSEYSIENCSIVDKKNNLYGISSISKSCNQHNQNYMYIDYMYDDLYIMGDILITVKDKEMIIKNLRNEMLTQGTIKLLSNNAINRIEYHNNNGKEDTNLIDIYLHCNAINLEENCDSAFIIYQYDVSKKELIQLK